MPALFLLTIVLLAYSALTADFGNGLKFMFEPDFSKLNMTVVLIALGQAFFSLSIGMGATLAYGYDHSPSSLTSARRVFSA